MLRGRFQREVREHSQGGVQHAQGGRGNDMKGVRYEWGKSWLCDPPPGQTIGEALRTAEPELRRGHLGPRHHDGVAVEKGGKFVGDASDPRGGNVPWGVKQWPLGGGATICCGKELPLGGGGLGEATTI